MKALGKIYYAVFCFWYRFDLLTKRRESRYWKAVIAVTVVQLWVIIGLYIWVEILFGAPPPPLPAAFVLVWVVASVNHSVLREGRWEQQEKEFDTRPATRSRRMAVGAAASLAAFLFLLLSAGVLRSSG